MKNRLERRKFLRKLLRKKVKFAAGVQKESCGVVKNISEDGMFVETKAPIDVDRDIIAYPDDLGRVSGKIIRVSNDGFAVQFDISDHDRALLKKRVNAAVKGQPYLSIADRRKYVRMPISIEATARIVPSGREFVCRITEISRMGASIQSNRRPKLFAEIKIGAIRGRVCRITKDGFAITFEKPGRRQAERESTNHEKAFAG